MRVKLEGRAEQVERGSNEELESKEPLVGEEIERLLPRKFPFRP